MWRVWGEQKMKYYLLQYDEYKAWVSVVYIAVVLKSVTVRWMFIYEVV